MKTANARISPIMHAPNGWNGVVWYRGKLLLSILQSDKRDCLSRIEACCKANGFTHINMTEESAWLKSTQYKIKLKGE